MKFKKYQDGGAIYTPFISSRGASKGQVSPYATSSTSSSKSEKPDTKIRDEIIKVLQESGINNDVDSFLQVANDFLVRSQNLSNASLFGGSDDSYSISDLTYVLSLANKVKQNKLQWDAAATNLREQDNSQEVAVASNGYLYVRSEDGFTTVSPEEFANNRDKYDALTNSQVLNLRQKLPGLAFNTEILNDLAGAISLETIQKQLLDIIDKFGETTRSEYIRRTGDNVSQSAWNGMRILIDQGPEGYYKVTNKTDLVNVENALDYLWRSLGADGQKRLRAEVTISGGDPNKNRYDLIAQMLEQHTSFTQDPNFDKSATDYVENGGSKSSGSGSGSPKYVEQTRAERYASGNGFGNPQWLPILSSDKATPMYISAQNLGPVLNKDEKTLFGDANLEEVLNESYGVGGIVDRSSITFGELPISWEDASKLMFESGTNMYRALIPAKTDAFGRIRPDFEMQAKIDHLNSTLGNMDAKAIKNAIADIPNVVYNEDTGLVEAINVKPFIVLQASASTDTLGGDLKNAKYLHNLTNQQDRNKKKRYNIITGSRPAYGGGEKRQDTGNPKTTWWMGYQFFEGNVFIPINDSIIAASVYNNQLVPQDTYINMSAKEQARQEQQQKQATVEELLQTGNLRFNF